jgi:glycosyltransferase involved in cell wall biosynthesis
MKILIFYQYFGTPKGGWSTRYYEFTRRWVNSGHEVTVVTSPYYKSDIKPQGFISKQQIEGVNLIVINSPDSNKDSFLKRALFAARFSLIAIYYSWTIPADCVISSSGPITTAIPGIFAKVFRNRKFVFEVRDLWPRGGIELGKLSNPLMQRVALSFEKFIYKKSDLIVACSPGMEEGVHKVCPNAKTLVISNSSDLQLFGSVEREINDKNSKSFPIFIYAGSLGLMDECSQILRGFKALKRRDFNFFFIGDGTEKEELVKLVEEYNLQEQVKFLGLIPKTEVVKWFAHATASFVTFKDIPVLHTNSPNKLFDSFAAGVPVIQSTKGWIADLVNNYHCGFNVDPNHPVSFADAMEQFLENPDLAIEMGKNARKLAELKFDRSVLSDKFLESIKSLAQ